LWVGFFFYVLLEFVPMIFLLLLLWHTHFDSNKKKQKKSAVRTSFRGSNAITAGAAASATAASSQEQHDEQQHDEFSLRFPASSFSSPFTRRSYQQAAASPYTDAGSHYDSTIKRKSSSGYASPNLGNVEEIEHGLFYNVSKDAFNSNIVDKVNKKKKKRRRAVASTTSDDSADGNSHQHDNI